MIKITKHEAEMLRERGRGMDIHIHNKTYGSRGKTYYLTESKASMGILNRYRKAVTHS